ncbi:MAG TPA: hypothetical protein VGD40_17800 [Chryseosolibacter sp.]
MKSKRIYNILTLSAALSFGLLACEDEVIVKVDDTTKADSLLALINTANEEYVTLDKENGDIIVANAKLKASIDSLMKLGGEDVQKEIHYTVNVISAANSEMTAGYTESEPLFGRSKGVTSATVVVEQNGKVQQPVSSGAGIFSFTGLRPGYVFVTVSAPDHTTLEYQAYLSTEAYVYSEGEVTFEGNVVNASTQVVLFPNAGALAAKVVGKAMANATALNDTLGRRYGSDAAIYGTRANTYISNPGPQRYSPSIDFEKAMSGHKIYAFPEIDNENPLGFESMTGWIVSMTYRDIITSATVAADGSFTLPVIASTETSGLIYDIYLDSEYYIGDYTYMSNSDNEKAAKVSYKYFNNTNGTQYVGEDGVEVLPGHSVVYDQYVVTEKYYMYPSFYYEGSWDSGLNKLPASGETITRNVFFWND